MEMAHIFECGMLLCFGFSWPLNVIKAYKARTAKGTSLAFITLIITGYLAGIAAKIINAQFNYVLAVYFLNLAIVFCNVVVYARNKSLDNKKPEKAEAKAGEPGCACFTCPSQEECKAAQEAGNAAPVEEKIDFSNVVIEPLFSDTVDFETFSKSDFRAVKVLECEAVPKSKKLLKFTLDDGTGTNRTILSGIHAFYEPEQLVGKTCVAITNLPPRAMMRIESCGMLLSAVHKEGEEERLNLLMLDPHIPAGAKLY